MSFLVQAFFHFAENFASRVTMLGFPYVSFSTFTIYLLQVRVKAILAEIQILVPSATWHIARLNSLSQVSFISKGDTSYIYAHQGAAQ